MTIRPLAPAIALVAFASLVAPRGASAQSRYTLTPFVASNSTLPGPSTLYGAAVATYPGLFGVRASGAVGGLSSRQRPGEQGVGHRVGGYTLDLDGVLSAGAIPDLGLILGGFVPSVFVGVGVEGGRATDSAATTSAPVVSYGLNVSRAMLGNVGLESEARYRVPTSLQGGGAPPGLARGWEYRVGLTIGFGRRARSLGGGLPLPRWPVVSVPAPRPGDGSTAVSASASRVLSTADRYVGTRYRYGGATPDGFDCSGFVQYVYRAQGVTLPRTSRQQVGVGERVSPAVRALRRGDLMLFDATGERAGIDHVAIYAGDNRMIHASSSGGGVRYDDLTSTRGAWFVKRMVAARRVVADGRGLVKALDASLRAQQLPDPPDHAPKP